MRRKIAKRREKEVYKQAELRRNFVELIQIITALVIIVVLAGGGIYWLASAMGKI